MGWGGDRRSAAARAARQQKDQKQVQDEKPARSAPSMFSAESVERILAFMQENTNRQRNRPRTMDWNPFVIRADRFGPAAAQIANKNPKLAMDQQPGVGPANQYAIQAWQAGGLLGNAVSEGLLFLGYPYLAELAQRAEFRLMGEIRAEEMVRRWTELRGTADESTKDSKKEPTDRNRDDLERSQSGEAPRSDSRNKEIEAKIKELQDFERDIKVRNWFKAAAAQDSFFGISQLYLDLKGVDVENLQDPELKTSIGNGRNAITLEKLKGKKGFLKGMRTIEPIWCYPTTYNAVNPLIETWYDPQVWYVMGTEIHKTRLLTFIGRPVPDILKPAYAFGGIAQTQLAQPYVDIWLRTRESVGELIHAFSVMVLYTNLSTTVQPGGSGGMNGDVLARMALANLARDNMGLQVVDKNSEDYKNVAAPLGSLDQLQAQAQEHMASVARIPLVKFTGISPSGLNATSEFEMRAFNDTIHGQQEHLYRSHLTTVYDLMQISLWGERDKDITYDFLPLMEMTDKEKAEIGKMRMETHQGYIDMGAVWQEEVRASLANDPDSGYDQLEPEDVPDLLEEEMAGLIPEGGGKGLQAELENAGGGGKKAKPNGRGSAEDDAPQDDPALIASNVNAPPKKKIAGGNPGFTKDDRTTPREAQRQAVVTGGGKDPNTG